MLIIFNSYSNQRITFVFLPVSWRRPIQNCFTQDAKLIGQIVGCSKIYEFIALVNCVFCHINHPASCRNRNTYIQSSALPSLFKSTTSPKPINVTMFKASFFSTHQHLDLIAKFRIIVNVQLSESYI